MAQAGGSAYLVGLTLLARRELSERQLRIRLARRTFDEVAIDDAVRRLRHERALDDERTARCCARTEIAIRRRGRARVLQRILALGIDRDTARQAVDEIFMEVDEEVLLEQALDRRLRHGTLDARGSVTRIHRYLVGQGFDASRVAAAIRRRTQQWASHPSDSTP